MRRDDPGEVKIPKATGHEILATIFDLFEMLDPEDTQWAEHTSSDRAGWRAALGDIVTQFPTEMVADHVMDWWGELAAEGKRAEARCTRCGETFVPPGADDMIHGAKADGTPCEGFGLIERWLG